MTIPLLLRLQIQSLIMPLLTWLLELHSKLNVSFLGLNNPPPPKKKIQCPIREAICKSCAKTGHYAKVCESKPRVFKSLITPCSAVSTTPLNLSKTVLLAKINGKAVDALLDTSSFQNFFILWSKSINGSLCLLTKLFLWQLPIYNLKLLDAT